MEWLDSKSRCPLCRTDFADEIMKHLMTNENKDSKEPRRTARNSNYNAPDPQDALNQHEHSANQIFDLEANQEESLRIA